MKGKYGFGLVIFLILVFSVLIAGCSSDNQSDTTPIPTPTLPVAKYISGDIIRSSSSADEPLYVIMQFDPVSDQYTRAWIYKNADGSWGHFISNQTEKSPRTVVEKVYTTKVSHVILSSIPIVTATIPAATIAPVSGSAPTLSNISPILGAKDATVSVTITGTNFQNGATVRLIQPGSPAVAASGVSVTSTSIDCVFNLYGKDAGTYNLIVTNPDGQSDSKADAFTVGNAPPIIGSFNPSTAELYETPTITVYGQNFQDPVKVTLSLGTTVLNCLNAQVIDPTKITCDLNLVPKTDGPAIGGWTVTVINIADSQKGISTSQFTITNRTSTSQN